MNWPKYAFLTLYLQMYSSFWCDTITLGWFIVYIKESYRVDFNFQKNIVFLFLKIIFQADSVDPDEMPQYVAFHLGHHCLPKNSESE